MSLVIQSWAQLLVLIVAIAGVLAWQTHYIDKRVDDLRAELNQRLDDLRAEVRVLAVEVRELSKALVHPGR
jgi:hypothetical protein